MARTDNDSWDIIESVDATALGVATARAAESARDFPLFTDPYAQLFIDAATERGWKQPPATAGHWRLRRSADQMVRRILHHRRHHGIDQAVILDARAWQLP
jgi:O-methyltransferase involved in polyketide biosynthesis